MAIPGKVKIGPFTYEVVRDEIIKGDQNQELYGHILYGPQTLAIKAGVSEERAWAILLHEAVHGIDEYMEIDLTEKQVSQLGTGLAAFFLDNGLLKE